MPNIDSICNMINATLQAGNFSTQKFQGAAYYGIADLLKMDGEHGEYKIIDNFGEGKDLSFNDIYPFQIYHRRENFTYRQSDENYGNAGQTMEETAPMRLIFMGSRARMRVRPENIMAALIIDFPKEFFQAVLTPLQLNSCIIEMGDINSDSYSVWAEEFQGTDYAVDSDSILISLHYRIITTYDKCCFSLC